MRMTRSIWMRNRPSCVGESAVITFQITSFPVLSILLDVDGAGGDLHIPIALRLVQRQRRRRVSLQRSSNLTWTGLFPHPGFLSVKALQSLPAFPFNLHFMPELALIMPRLLHL